MKNFTKNILMVSLSVFTGSGVLQAQQSGVTKGTLTLSNLTAGKIEKVEMKSKEISREVTMPKNGEVYIENSSRNIVIKTWDQPKVKITTTVQYEGEGNYTEDEWFEKANLSLKTLGSSVKIKAGLVNNLSPYTTLYNTGNNNLTEVVVTGQAMSSTKSPKKQITVYLPAGSKIDIESKYSEITLPANIGDVNVDISNGNLDAENLGKLILRSKYTIVNIGDVKNAEIEFTGGRLTAKNIDDLDLDSKYSTIELALAKKAVIRSTNDEYEFEEVGELSGRKNYGNFRITKLMQKIELDGVNADIKVRNIAPTASLIKINDKYADIRLPIKNTKNYTVDFLGAYSSVYGNFEKKSLPVSDKDIPFLGMAVVSDSNMTKPILVAGKRISPTNDNSKPNITSLGTLSNLTVARSIPVNGDMIVSGYITDKNGNIITSSNSASSVTAGTLVNASNLSVTGIRRQTAKAEGGYNEVSDAQGGQLASITTDGRLSASTTNTSSGGTSVSGTGSANAITVSGQVRSTAGKPVFTSSSQVRDGIVVSDVSLTRASRAYSYSVENDTPPKFSATSGDGKGLKIELKCPNCTVDFK